MWFYSHFQKDVSYAQCLSFFARKAWTSQAPYPREATTIGGDICLHSPFSSNIFYYIQLNKYSSGQALIKSLWNHPLYEIVQQPQVQNIAASP